MNHKLKTSVPNIISLIHVFASKVKNLLTSFIAPATSLKESSVQKEYVAKSAFRPRTVTFKIPKVGKLRRNLV